MPIIIIIIIIINYYYYYYYYHPNKNMIDKKSFEFGRPRLKRWKNFGRSWSRGMGGLQIEQFSMTLYVYRP